LLAGGRAVEIDERLAADLLLEHRKVLANPLDVQGCDPAAFAKGLGRHATSCSCLKASSREVTSSCTRARSGASGMRFTISLAKAYVSTLFAACWEMPRERRYKSAFSSS